MNKISESFARGSIFYVLYAVFFAALAILLLLIPKAELHLWLNQFHTPFLDSFFFYATQLGDGLFVIIIAITLLFLRYRYALGILVTFAVSGDYCPTDKTPFGFTSSCKIF